MSAHHPEVLAPVPAAAAFLSYRRSEGASVAALVDGLNALTLPDGVLVGIGPAVVSDLGRTIPGLAELPDLSQEGALVDVPRTPIDLWVRVSGADPGEVLHRTRSFTTRMPQGLDLVDHTEGFLHNGGRDLTGYEDGTENPDADEAPQVALAHGHGPGIDGGSVLAVQRWVHTWADFDAMDKQAQDHAIGRERVSNDELEDAPESAHVKRTAQEDFDPEAFVWRRSMPWSDARGSGLVFLAFAATLDPFLAQMRRMAGIDDGITDALFQFTRPVTGSVVWCPPVRDNQLDLRALVD